MVIYSMIAAPNVNTGRPGGLPVEAGDIWINMTGARQRFDGAAWVPYNPVVVYAATPPANRNTPPGGAIQEGDIWVHQTTGAQQRRAGTGWDRSEPPAGIVPMGTAADLWMHVVKSGMRPFESGLADPADGIAFLYRRTSAADTWVIFHNLRSRWVAVTVVDDTRTPPVTMIPSISYEDNECTLHFARAVRGYAVVHASKSNVDLAV